ncbi:MAG: type II toxin-antitoxin system VapB family antitoxin [Cyclobacteriaceae bacterium]|jgi:Arc/MetJ family transcription regulator|nr:type II toxin-antitoxin system VapB family antitoxin [Cyclobacteriaceae bacterium]
MRTTLDISSELLSEAMKISGAKTKSQVIKEALQEMIAREKRQRLLNFKGKVDLDVDLDILRERV